MYNHYIPQFYTKRWAKKWNGSKGFVLIRYSRPYNEVVCDDKPTVSIGGQEDLYKIPHINDGTEHELETKFFSGIDHKASLVMNKIEREGIDYLSADERTHWSAFIISLRQRTPNRLKELGDRIEVMFRGYLENHREAYQSIRRPSDPVTFEEFEQNYRTIERIAQARISLLKNAIELPNSTQAISNSLWKIITIGANETELLTSDRPVFIDESQATEGGLITLPMSPTSVFVASRNVVTLAEKTAQPDLSESMNDIVVTAAEKEVYGTSCLLKEFVERRLRMLPVNEDIVRKRAARLLKKMHSPRPR